MTAELALIDTNVLVHAYTVSNQRKHQAALTVVERVWAGGGSCNDVPERW